MNLIPESEYILEPLDAGETEADNRYRACYHPIYDAIARGDIEAVKYYIPTLPDINKPYLSNEHPRAAVPTPIYYAAEFNQLEILKLLQENGGDIHWLNKHNQGILLYAGRCCEDKPNETFEYLLGEKVDVFLRQSKNEFWVWERFVFSSHENNEYYIDLLATHSSIEELKEIKTYLDNYKRVRRLSPRAAFQYAKKVVNDMLIVKEEQAVLNTQVSLAIKAADNKNKNSVNKI